MFSVLVPVYNHERYIGAALDSLLAQTCPDWEAVVVNDGSTDGTAAIIEEYSRRDSRIRVFHKSNGGVSTALNMGLDQARGDWICWLSSDDLFTPDKLALHAEWSRRHPDCRFFFTHYRTLDDATGAIAEPDLWAPVPNTRWQILEMLRCTYIHGNSVCVRRSAFDSVGRFDVGLRYAQDYDMWLRLLANNPAVYIPHRTCITRVHGQQQTQRFSEALFYDSARAAISFINTHTFTAILPTVDVRDVSVAMESMHRALDVSNNTHAHVYGLGFHAGLIGRVMEWLWDGTSKRGWDRLRKGFIQRCRVGAKGHEGDTLGLMWKSALQVVDGRKDPVAFRPVKWGSVAAFAREDDGSPMCGSSEVVRRYLEANGVQVTDVETVSGRRKTALIVCQKGASLPGSVRYGTSQATVEMARGLRKHGWKSVLVALSSCGIWLEDEVLYVGCESEAHLERVVAHLGAGADAVIGISRADFLRMAAVRRPIIYHHGPHFIQGAVTAHSLNKMRVRVVCVSEYSRQMMIEEGIDGTLVSVVPNGYCRDVFFSEDLPRDQKALVVAGHINYGKGTDIALAAFAALRKAYPDATLTICGANCVWSETRHLLRAGWLDKEGRIDWGAVEKDLSGVRYMGELPSHDLAGVLRRSSMLLMPSRLAETFGIVSLEAQACGCIPVLPNLGGMPETVDDGTTGYLFTAGSAEGLARRVIDVWSRQEPADEQRDKAAKRVEGSFSWSHAAGLLAGILMNVSERACFEQHKWLLYVRLVQPLRVAWWRLVSGMCRFS